MYILVVTTALYVYERIFGASTIHKLHLRQC